MVLRFFSSKIYATLVAPDHPLQTSASFSAQLEARINDKVLVISYNRVILNTATEETAIASFSFQLVNLQ